MQPLCRAAGFHAAAALSLLYLLAPAVHAQPAPAPAANSEAARQAEIDAAWKAASGAATRGPADVALIDQAVLKLPASRAFIPKAEGMRIMRALGNTISETTFIGLIVGTRQNDDWLVVARYVKEGYIKDDDAKNWNADELLQSLKDGTAEANKDRVARGFPELEVSGWVEKPAYDAGAHRLVWSILAINKGEPESGPKGINYNTYALGRDGYFSLNLLTNSSRIEADKAVARELLSDLSYNSGKRYEDFTATTDRIAEYGIAALIGGVVAKKIGLFALIGVFFLKFAKIIAVAAIALAAGAVKFFRRKPAATPPGGPA